MSRGRRSRDRGYISGNRIIAAPTYDEVLVNYLVVAGGGSGGVARGGGGGAGGYRNSVSGELTGGGGSAETPITLLTSNSYLVTVGAGGAGVSGASQGNNGNNSVFHAITSTGGGGGGNEQSAGLVNGLSGGSGGGGSARSGSVGTGGGVASPTQGYAGGNGFFSTDGAGGGGGGAGAVGGNATSLTSAAGGNGLSSSITGSAVTRGGGGGGNGGTQGAGGTGGGGAGGVAGTANTGGGGGSGTSIAGGSGVVILRYSNLYTLNIGAGLSYSTQTVNDDKVTTFTGGSGSISLSPAPVTTGDYESIATVLVGSTSASSITFSNIPQTYKHLQIRANYSANATNDNTHMRFNGDTSASYSWHETYSSSTESPGTVISGNHGGTLVTTAKFGYVGSTSTGVTGVVISDILDYASTNKNKVARHLAGTHTNGSSSYILFRSVAWYNTNAVTSITIYFSGLITQHSHFALYGIRG